MRYWLIFIFCAFIFTQSNAQESCFNNDSKYYYVSKIIKRSQYKKQNLNSSEKTNLRQELINQISTKISVVSVLNTENIVTGESGSFNSIRNTSSIISSVGSVNNARFIYCKSGRKYLVYCAVEKRDFENDLFNDMKAKVNIFGKKITSLSESVVSGNLIVNIEELDKLKRTYTYLNDGIGFLSSSVFVDVLEKESLVNEIAITSANYLKLDNKINSGFEKQLQQLNKLLIKKQYEQTYFGLISLSRNNINPTQQQQLTKFERRFLKDFGGYISDLDQKIEKAIRNRDDSENTQLLLDKYLQTSFFKNQLNKWENYKRRLLIRSGFGKSNLYLGILGGTSFQNIDQSSGQIQFDNVNENLNFNQILPAFEIGLKHLFFDPRKRFGISISYKSYSDTFIGASDEQTTVGSSINGFNILQFGINKGPIEIKYGTPKSNTSLEELKLISLRFDLIRTDKLSNRFAKSNYLSISAFGDYLSDFKDNSFLQLGISLNYHFIFNRTSKY